MKQITEMALGILANFKSDCTCIYLYFSMFCVEYAKSVRYTDLQRPVIEEDIVKAIKFKLNNEEQAFRKQHEEQQKSTKE
jgi:hypothetical protein